MTCVFQNQERLVEMADFVCKMADFTEFLGVTKHVKKPNTTCCVDKHTVLSLPTRPVELVNLPFQVCFYTKVYAILLRFVLKTEMAKRK